MISPLIEKVGVVGDGDTDKLEEHKRSSIGEDSEQKADAALHTKRLPYHRARPEKDRPGGKHQEMLKQRD